MRALTVLLSSFDVSGHVFVYKLKVRTTLQRHKQCHRKRSALIRLFVWMVTHRYFAYWLTKTCMHRMINWTTGVILFSSFQFVWGSHLRDNQIKQFSKAVLQVLFLLFPDYVMPIWSHIRAALYLSKNKKAYINCTDHIAAENCKLVDGLVTKMLDKSF